MTIIDATDLTVRKAGTTILENVDFQVASGDQILVRGRSGSGKTTLFHTLGLLEPVTSGQLTIQGTDVTSLSEVERARLRRDEIGLVFQEFSLIPDLSAWENARLPQEHTATIDETWLETVFDQLELDSVRDHYPATLSGGEKQRVAIARAIANRPSIVLADEPTGQLDPATTRKVLTVLSEVSELCADALIVTSHDQAISEEFPISYQFYSKGGSTTIEADGDGIPGSML